MPRRAGLFLVAVTALVLMFGWVDRAGAQGFTNASKTMDITPFGGAMVDFTHLHDQNDTGYVVGIDITRYLFPLPVAPSLEGRVNQAFGTSLNQKSYVFGVKLQSLPGYFRMHPYVNFLTGPGTVHYKNTLPGQILGDNSTVYSYGGGVDVPVLLGVKAKADVQYQSWKLGHANSFTPVVLTLGVSYNIPFRPHFKQADPSGK